MKFRDYFSLRQILFSIAIVLLVILFAIIENNNRIKVTFYESDFLVKADHYSIRVSYSEIETVSFTDLAEAGEEIADGSDDGLLRTGNWRNDIWGEYYICADSEISKCIVLKLTDGQTYVFSRKDDKTTEALYQELLIHLN